MNTSNRNGVGTDRVAGVLMPVASLPSQNGVGSFGKEAYAFVDMLAEMGMGTWQILPLNPLGYGNSPYQPFSSYAGDALYIDLDLLEQEGYLAPGRKPYCHVGKAGRIDYVGARTYKEAYLREAYQKFFVKSWYEQEVASFREMAWVKPYAVFMALKKQNDLRCWNEWPKEQQDWILDGKYDLVPLRHEIRYQIFLQFVFYKQWMALKTYANSKNVKIMGDVPFYVGMDSADVWSSREDFLLEKGTWKPSFVAGVPPDYFSATGQRWGNPIYNWEKLQEKNFSFWIERLRYSAELYDIIRIDHFRAFDSYWKIAASCPTAVDGEWMEAPGEALFTELYRQMPNIAIVAEDLGDLRPEVLQLRDKFGLMGMNILEFTLEQPWILQEHQLVYTGTHDNQTVKGWYASLPESRKRKIRKALSGYGTRGEAVPKRMVRYTYASKAKLAIVPLYDLLGLDDSARLNFPSTVGSPNWEWCLRDWKELRKKMDYIREAVVSSGRSV